MPTFHITYELGGAPADEALPGGPEWLAVIESTPADERHLALHTGHLMYLINADAAAWDASAHALLPRATLTGTADRNPPEDRRSGGQGCHRDASRGASYQHYPPSCCYVEPVRPSQSWALLAPIRQSDNRMRRTTKKSPWWGGVAGEENTDGAFHHGGDVLFGDGVAEEGVFADFTVDKHAELV